jgi:hypothetical protein
VADHDVPELRQLVEAGAAEPTSQPGDPGIVRWQLPPVGLVGGAQGRIGQHFIVGAVTHGAELHELEGSAVTPDPLLPVQDRATTGEGDQHGQREQERSSEDEADGADRHVDRPLDGQ